MPKQGLVIGLTGSLATGKSTVAALFARRGAKVIDADDLTRRLLAENKKIIKKVAKVFPGAILNSEINRKQLAKQVFQNPRELKKLTDILYPEAVKAVKKRISSYHKAPFIILDVPLLFEAGWDALADLTVVVKARRQQQIQRGQKRLHIPKKEICQRLKLQMPLKAKCARADIIIDNSGTLSSTRRQVGAIIDRLRKRKQ